MLNDILMWGCVATGVGAGGYAINVTMALSKRLDEAGMLLFQAKDTINELEAKVKDLQSILTAAPPDMIAQSVVASEWRTAMLALPEGSPKRQAYESRLKQLGAS
jgi:hypothetical protein